MHVKGFMIYVIPTIANLITSVNVINTLQFALPASFEILQFILF